MKGFRTHAKFLRHWYGLKITSFVCLWKVLSKVPILKTSSNVKGPSNDQKAVQITNPSYATRSPAKSSTSEMESLLHSHSKHPSYKSILLKYKKCKALFPTAQTAYTAPVLLQNLPEAWGGGMLLFPTVVSPTPGTSPEGQRVGNPRSKRETAEKLMDTRLQWALLEPIRSS